MGCTCLPGICMLLVILCMQAWAATIFTVKVTTRGGACQNVLSSFQGNFYNWQSLASSTRFWQENMQIMRMVPERFLVVHGSQEALQWNNFWSKKVENHKNFRFWKQEERWQARHWKSDQWCLPVKSQTEVTSERMKISMSYGCSYQMYRFLECRIFFCQILACGEIKQL